MRMKTILILTVLSLKNKERITKKVVNLYSKYFEKDCFLYAILLFTTCTVHGNDLSKVYNDLFVFFLQLGPL
jgi:hypothetical protein